MACVTKELFLATSQHDQVVDITEQVRNILKQDQVIEGQCTVYTPHATAAIAINENDDPNIGEDFLRFLADMVPAKNQWLHDRIDGNAAAHMKSALVGPSVVIPVSQTKLCLGPWQNIFFCEFDGPRHHRRVIVSIVS